VKWSDEDNERRDIGMERNPKGMKKKTLTTTDKRMENTKGCEDVKM